MSAASRDILRTFGANVRRFRTAKQLSQERLAERADLHRTYVGGIERGERNVSLLNISYLARALGVTPADLLRGITSAMLENLPLTHRAPRRTRVVRRRPRRKSESVSKG